jgi:hypothetical protein
MTVKSLKWPKEKRMAQKIAAEWSRREQTVLRMR